MSSPPALLPSQLNMIKNDYGQVAVKYLSPNAARAMDKYFFKVRARLSLCWIAPEDWEILKDRIVGCCGNTDKLFYLATQREVERWLEG